MLSKIEEYVHTICERCKECGEYDHTHNNYDKDLHIEISKHILDTLVTDDELDRTTLDSINATMQVKAGIASMEHDSMALKMFIGMQTGVIEISILNNKGS